MQNAIAYFLCGVCIILALSFVTQWALLPAAVYAAIAAGLYKAVWDNTGESYVRF